MLWSVARNWSVYCISFFTMAYAAQFKVASQLCGFGTLTSAIFLMIPISHSAMRESPEKAAAHWLECDSSMGEAKKKLPIIDAAAMDRFRDHGVLIIDDVLSAAELRSAQKDLLHLLDSKIFQVTEQHSEDIRTDLTCLISEPITNQRLTLGAGMRDALRIVRSVPFQLLSNGSGSDEALYGVPLTNQLSCYNGLGSHYRPHRDTPKSSSHPLNWLLQAGLDDRETTIILYLNDVDWDVGDDYDGCLRCFLGTLPDDDVGSSATSILNIAPKGGRMVIFESRKVLHEVRPCSKQRAAITCWVGGSHSMYEFLRPFCIPYDEIKFS